MDKLESKKCPFCDKMSLEIFTDPYGTKWVVCGNDKCTFDSFWDGE